MYTPTHYSISVYDFNSPHDPEIGYLTWFSPRFYYTYQEAREKLLEYVPWNNGTDTVTGWIIDDLNDQDERWDLQTKQCTRKMG